MKKIVYVTLFCLISGLASAETFYRWKDDQGATHYTLAAPEGRSSTSIEIATGVTSETGADDTEAASAPTPVAKPADTKAAPESQVTTYKERCDQYRKNLDLLKSGGELTTKDKDGKLHTLNADERAKQLANTQEMLGACPPASK